MVNIKKLNRKTKYINKKECATENCKNTQLYYKYKDKPEKYCSYCRKLNYIYFLSESI